MQRPRTSAAPTRATELDLAALVDKLGMRVLDGDPLGFEDALRLVDLDLSLLPHLMSWADRIRRHFRGDEIHLCSIVNAKSGGCTEDCSFCAQSARHQTQISVYPFLATDEVLEAAREAHGRHAQALGLVAAWRGLREGPMLERVLERVRELTASGTVRADASLGIIESESVAHRLREAGLVAYNHNLEAAKSYYPKVCSTHTYEERVQTIRHLKAAGLRVCSGGIIGLGETPRQRVELAFELRELDVDIVPINFLNPIAGTPLEHMDPLSPRECLRTISLFRFVLPDKEIMIAGGREVNLRDLQSMMFMAGASATMVGHYLTTSGRRAEDDLSMISDLGLSWDWHEE
ncbi:biotin synthase BioB [Candidatus Poribacteria bacterium]|nr:biotin synthase BioB [Candidatus Poribacteria bacterium]